MIALGVVRVAAEPVVFWLNVGQVNVPELKLPEAGVPNAGVVSVGLVRVLFVRVSVPANVARVPVVGRVTAVLAVAVNC